MSSFNFQDYEETYKALITSNPTVAGESLAFKWALDELTARRPIEWSFPTGRQSEGSSYHGAGAARYAVGPDALGPDHKAWGPGGLERGFTYRIEVGCHGRIDISSRLETLAASVDLLHNSDVHSGYWIDVQFDFRKGVPRVSYEDERMLRKWFALNGNQMPLGRVDIIPARMHWKRRFWVLGKKTFFGGLKPPDFAQRRQAKLETDLVSWAYDTGDYTTWFFARVVTDWDPTRAVLSAYETAATKLADKVRDLVQTVAPDRTAVETRMKIFAQMRTR